jgi:hypothetical protein
MKKTDVIPGRAYQIQSGNYILPELIPLAYGEGTIEYLDPDEFDAPSQYYEAMKAQCALIEEVFESEDQLNEAANLSDDGWSFYSDHPLVLQEFAEIWEGERASDECLFEFFRDSVANEFQRFKKQYDKHDLDEVISAYVGMYSLVPDENGGANWRRDVGGTAAPVRATSAVEEEEVEDGSEY